MRNTQYKTFVLLLTILVFCTVGVTQDMMYQEAPMLAEQVAAGELPPVKIACLPIHWSWSRSTKSGPTAAPYAVAQPRSLPT